MHVNHVLAAVAVSDLQQAEAWYADLFGRAPDARPMDGLLEWYFGAAGDLQLVHDPDRAGGSLLTLRVDAIPDAAGKTTAGEDLRMVEDPDGNAVTLLAGHRDEIPGPTGRRADA